MFSVLLHIQAEPKLYFITPSDGETVSCEVIILDGDTVNCEFIIKFGLSDFGVAPAGYDIPNTGHHHLIINAPLPDFSLPIPANENYIHFGLGQTETLISLPPGKHRLQLLLGNYVHIPHSSPLISNEINIVVE